VAGPVLDYRGPQPPPESQIFISGWISLVSAMMVIPLAFVAGPPAFVFLLLSFVAGIYSLRVSGGRSITGWIGTGISGLILAALSAAVFLD